MLVGVGDCVEADDSGGGQRECPLIVLHVRLYLAVFVVSVKLFWRGVWRGMPKMERSSQAQIAAHLGEYAGAQGFWQAFFSIFFQGKGDFFGLGLGKWGFWGGFGWFFRGLGQ